MAAPLPDAEASPVPMDGCLLLQWGEDSRKVPVSGPGERGMRIEWHEFVILEIL
ncbi:hypothetical protein Btus_1796 [Kyrpidia tusciae DSM 2912]|uniref:Uncharacterized protein n=1 Tax=Kyrpidia tusciae (strain DSM 2912 / NBRC 15312 / T2) TaxID=562970 RepID=D5WQ87_KYRT2|nr:hypothetical protein Btus_1796 [Kyrpidia tusciae DSM 2912]